MKYQYSIHDMDHNIRKSGCVDGTAQEAQETVNKVINGIDLHESSWMSLPNGYKKILVRGCAYIMEI